VITEQTAAAKASASNAKLDRSELDKRLKAERAKERRPPGGAPRPAGAAGRGPLSWRPNPFAPHPLVAPTPRAGALSRPDPKNMLSETTRVQAAPVAIGGPSGNPHFGP